MIWYVFISLGDCNVTEKCRGYDMEQGTQTDS